MSSTIYEKLLKPAAKIMTNIVLRKKAQRAFGKIPLLNDMRNIAQWKWLSMEEQLVLGICRQMFGCRFRENTNRLRTNKLKQHRLVVRHWPKHGEAIFHRT